MNKFMVLATLSLLSMSAFANEECYMPEEALSRGQQVYVEYVPYSVVKQRSNGNYILKMESVEESSVNNSYLTNAPSSTIFTTNACVPHSEDSSLQYRTGQVAYAYVYSVGKYVKMNIEAIRLNGQTAMVSQLNDEYNETESFSPFYESINSLFNSDACTNQTDDEVIICTGDTAISLEYGLDATVVGILQDLALVRLENSDQYKVTATSNLILNSIEQ